MRITGHFNDINDKTRYDILIERPGDGLSQYEIKDQEFDDHSICWGDDPINIECDYSDTFSHVIIKSATIDFVTNFNLKDIILANNNRDISCTITATNLEVANAAPQTIFFGYVEPLCFNEPYAHNWESISITATDILATSQYIKYPPLMLEDYDPETDEIDPWHDMWSTTATLNKICDKLELTLDISNLSSDIVTALSTTKISNSIWIGESPDDFKMCSEVLETLGKYWNIWFIVEGNTLVAINWHNQNRTPIQLTKNDVGGADTNLSNADAYTQIKLACNVEDADAIIQFGDDLASPYTHYALYLDELVSEGGGDNAFNAYRTLLLNNETIDDGKKHSYIYKNFCWVKKSNLWDFYVDPNDPNDESYVTYANLNGTPNKTQQEILKWLRDKRGKAAFVSFGRTDKSQSSNNAPINSIDLKDYLIISIMGDDSTTNIMSFPNEICSFSGSSTAFTPADSDTTNYIVISGQILLNKLYAQTGFPMHCKYKKNGGGEYDEVNGNLGADAQHTLRDAKELLSSTNTTLMNWSLLLYEKTVPRISDNNYGAYYNHQYYNGNAGNEQKTDTPCLYGDLKQDKFNKTMKYEYSYVDGKGKRIDNTSKIPILECELKIGEGDNAKYCVERMDLPNGSGWGKFEWLTQAEITAQNITLDGDEWKHFTIGIDPKCDDYIIGQTYDIQNTIWYYDDVDAKGTAIPIHFSDALAGPVSFKIIKPFNITWEKTNKSVHGWLFKRTHWNTTYQPILEKLSSIMISDFKIELTSDKGKIQNNTANNDLVYASNMNDKYIEDHEDDVDICSMITSKEAADWGTDMVISKSHVVNSDGTPFYGFPVYENNPPAEDEEPLYYIKPEQMYVDGFYQEYFKPRTVVESSIFINRRFDWLLNPTAYRFYINYVNGNLGQDATLSDNAWYTPVGYDADLKYNKAKFTFKDMKYIPLEEE